MSTYFSQREFVRKTIDQSVTNSTTLVSDTSLVFPISSGEVWVADYFLRLGSGSALFKFSILAPSGATVRYHVFSSMGTSSAVTLVDTNGGTGTSQASTNSATCMAEIHVMVENGSTAGSVNLQWAQQTTSGLANTVKAGSYLLANRVA